jgi:hypothetical protein
MHYLASTPLATWLLILWPVSSLAQQPAAKQTPAVGTPSRFRVNIDAGSINPESLRNLVVSHLEREFRALGDVDVVDEDADPGYVLHLIGYDETKASGGDGFTLAVAVVKPLQVKPFADTIEKKTDVLTASIFRYSFAGAVSFERLSVFGGRMQDIPRGLFPDCR